MCGDRREDDSGVTRIDVTPEMVRAGVAAYLECDRENDPDDQIVRAIAEAVLASICQVGEPTSDQEAARADRYHAMMGPPPWTKHDLEVWNGSAAASGTARGLLSTPPKRHADMIAERKARRPIKATRKGAE